MWVFYHAEVGIGEIKYDLETEKWIEKVDRTKLKISKWKNISAVTKITNLNENDKNLNIWYHKEIMDILQGHHKASEKLIEKLHWFFIILHA